MISAWNTNTTLTTDVHTENVTIGQPEEIFCISIREITEKITLIRRDESYIGNSYNVTIIMLFLHSYLEPYRLLWECSVCKSYKALVEHMQL